MVLKILSTHGAQKPTLTIYSTELIERERCRCSSRRNVKYVSTRQTERRTKRAEGPSGRRGTARAPAASWRGRAACRSRARPPGRAARRRSCRPRARAGRAPCCTVESGTNKISELHSSLTNFMTEFES